MEQDYNVVPEGTEFDLDKRGREGRLRTVGRVLAGIAQRQSTPLTREGSQVQTLLPALFGWLPSGVSRGRIRSRRLLLGDLPQTEHGTGGSMKIAKPPIWGLTVLSTSTL